jgi:hypothetical protein
LDGWSLPKFNSPRKAVDLYQLPPLKSLTALAKSRPGRPARSALPALQDGREKTVRTVHVGPEAHALAGLDVDAVLP